jgi:hypothetical protein
METIKLESLDSIVIKNGSGYTDNPFPDISTFAFLYFGQDSCFDCGDVNKIISDIRIYPVYRYRMQNETAECFRVWNITRTPTTLFVTNTGNTIREVSRKVGYVTRENYNVWIKECFNMAGISND